MIDALGLLEVRGLACGIEAADAMLKAASVRLLRQAVTNPALVTLVVEGDLAACRAALDAGAALATRRGCLVSRKEIGRERFVEGFRYLKHVALLGRSPPAAAVFFSPLGLQGPHNFAT